MIIWLTGVPASGKTTIGKKLARVLDAAFLDSHDIRRSPISRGLGFSDDDRALNLRRVGWIAEKLNEYTDVVCAFVSPHDDIRKELPIDMLVWIKCSIETAIERDPKGLYAMARKGAIVGLTGFDAPYEEPIDPDIIIETENCDVESAVKFIEMEYRQRTQ